MGLPRSTYYDAPSVKTDDARSPRRSNHLTNCIFNQ